MLYGCPFSLLTGEEPGPSSSSSSKGIASTNLPEGMLVSIKYDLTVVAHFGKFYQSVKTKLWFRALSCT